MKQHLLPKTLIVVTMMLIALFGKTYTAQAQTKYALWVADVEVTSDNADNITGSRITGKVSYDAATKTLTLNNATVTGRDLALWSKIEGLTVKLVGYNKLKAEETTAVYLRKSCTFQGIGSLIVEAPLAKAIIVDEDNVLTFKDCYVEAKGKWGIASWGKGKGKETLIIDHANVRAKGEKGSICDFSRLILKGSVIFNPTGAVWNQMKHAICDQQDNVITKEVYICLERFLITNIEVIAENSSNITGKGISGKVSYDAATKTLTLDNATITGTSFAIWAFVKDLTVQVIGNNTLKGENNLAFLLEGSCTFEGTGTLNLETPKYYAAIAINEDKVLTFKDCTVNAKGQCGIKSYIHGTGTLIIDHAKVTAEGKGGSICNFSQLILKGCAITQPAGAVWNAEKKGICDAQGNLITEPVVIQPVPEAVERIDADTARRHGIYDLSGQALGTDFDRLPHGVYIVNGQKVVK